MYLKNKAFTLIEILVGVLIFSLVMIGGFKALSAITIGKIRLTEKTNIEKESIYFTEKLFQLIKNGGTIDYEEYFNRKVVGTTYASGHYMKETGFGNFGSGGIIGTTIGKYGNNFYYCASGNQVNIIGTGGCFIPGKYQRYGEYSFQFIDYNSNHNDDITNCSPKTGIKLGDEDCNGNIIGDDDDEYIGTGPKVFTSGIDVKEIYLISGDNKTRTILRWSVIKDPNTPVGINCNFGNGAIPTGSGCLGTIQFLQLKGKDWGFNHNGSGLGLSDGVIDTWIISNNFIGNSNTITGSGSNYEQYWQDLFPKSMNIKKFRVEVYPNTDIKLAWKEKVNISPYLRISFSIAPSWKNRKKMKGKFPELNFSTTVNLTDIYSK